jgi:hypothetical protein
LVAAFALVFGAIVVQLIVAETVTVGAKRCENLATRCAGIAVIVFRHYVAHIVSGVDRGICAFVVGLLDRWRITVAVNGGARGAKWSGRIAVARGRASAALEEEGHGEQKQSE